jgi:hypothetical protein
MESFAPQSLAPEWRAPSGRRFFTTAASIDEKKIAGARSSRPLADHRTVRLYGRGKMSTFLTLMIDVLV